MMTEVLQTCLRIGIAIVLIMVGMQAAYVGFLTYMPITHWVDYQGILIHNAPAPELQEVEVFRMVEPRKEALLVQRHVELHEETPNGNRQFCLYTILTTAEHSTKPSVFFYLRDYLPDCDWKRLEGRKMVMESTWSVILPFTISRSVTLKTDPFVVTDGRLVTTGQMRP